MATATANISVMQEIHDLGGEIAISGLSKAQFYQLAAHHPELLMEREKNGTINILTPLKGGSGIREHKLSLRISYFCKQHLGGQTFSPSTGFNLPDGSTKSPDLAWISDQ